MASVNRMQMIVDEVYVPEVAPEEQAAVSGVRLNIGEYILGRLDHVEEPPNEKAAHRWWISDPTGVTVSVLIMAKLLDPALGREYAGTDVLLECSRGRSFTSMETGETVNLREFRVRQVEDAPVA